MRDHAIAHGPEGPADTVKTGPLDTLARLVVQRLALSQDVATAKYASCHSIEDPVRERRVLEAAASELIWTGGRLDAGLQFIRDQIEANRVIQRELHHRWYTHPEEVPAVHRELAEEVWPDLDLVTIQLILQLNCMTHPPRLRLDLIEDLIRRQFAATMPAPPLPRLHRHAALFALRSFCLEW